MFYYLRGFAQSADMAGVVMDVCGVGYLLSVSSFTKGEVLKNGSEKEMLLYTHMAVREDAVELYGFADKTELDMFRLLISVSGIGPKVALSVLSSFTPGELAGAVLSDNKKAISSANGIGAKTAARIVLELKDKIAGFKTDEDDSADAKAYLPEKNSNDKLRDVSDSLSSLGYTRSEISSVMNKIDRSSDVESMIKEALRYLMRQL